MPKNVQNVG